MQGDFFVLKQYSISVSLLYVGNDSLLYSTCMNILIMAFSVDESRQYCPQSKSRQDQDSSGYWVQLQKRNS